MGFELRFFINTSNNTSEDESKGENDAKTKVDEISTLWNEKFRGWGGQEHRTDDYIMLSNALGLKKRVFSYLDYLKWCIYCVMTNFLS